MRILLLLNFLYIGYQGFTQTVKIVNLQANDITYNHFDQKLYCSTPSSIGANGNSIVVIDPITATIDTIVYIGSEPLKLAVADNGKTIAIGMNGSAQVVLFDVINKSIRNQFSLGSGGSTGPYFVNDIEFLPNNDSTVVVSRRNYGFSPSYEGIAVYDNGSMRPTVSNDFSGSNTIEFVNDSIFFGYNNETTEFGIRSHKVDISGVTDITLTLSLASGFYADMIFSEGN